LCENDFAAQGDQKSRMRSNGLMPRVGGRPGSRDYYLPTIPCAVIACPANRNGSCTMASAIEIRADGKCKTGVDFMEMKEFKVKRRPLDGD
jgi:hypothetical protein